MNFFLDILKSAWGLLLESSVYMIFGLLVGGLLKVFLNPNTVANHLGRGRFSSVFKAALLGVPLPLCSCGVLPAAVSLKKQGASNGAVSAFLISTPESGVDSIAITYALTDPLMTVARPLSALFSGTLAGVLENLLGARQTGGGASPDLTCVIDSCCDGRDCPPAEHARHHTFGQKVLAGLRFALTDIWADMAGWFLIGLLLAGLITVLLPTDLMTRYLGGGPAAMLLMLGVGLPLYICATASTPIAAALILKGVSPGAALVFLLAGPATNMTSLTVLFGLLGRRAAAIYLGSISLAAIVCGLTLDWVYHALGLSAQAMIGQASEIMPFWLEVICGLLLLGLSIGPVSNSLKKVIRWVRNSRPPDETKCTTSA